MGFQLIYSHLMHKNASLIYHYIAIDKNRGRRQILRVAHNVEYLDIL